MAKLQEEPKADGEAQKEESKEEKKQSVNGKIVECIGLLQRGTRWKDSKLLNGRFMRQTAVLRTMLDPFVLKNLTSKALPETLGANGTIQELLSKASAFQTCSWLNE